MSGITKLVLFVAVIAVALVSQSLYTVDEREKVVVFQFGKTIRWDDQPGIHVKIPFIQNVEKYNARIQTLDAEAERYLTSEKKNLVVDSFVKWRVRNVRKYFVTVGGNPANARTRLAQRVNSSLRQQFGERTVKQVISDDRVTIMEQVRKAVDDEAGEIGVEVVDVRLKRVDLDKAVSESVYRRMEAERERVAKDFRAKGAEEAEKIQADADRRVTIMLANAERDAQQLRGEGDGRATAIYADAFGEDLGFYKLYRSLNAYKNTFKEKSDFMVLSPESEFFQYFKGLGPGGDSDDSGAPPLLQSP